MRFAYLAAALLPLAFANNIALETPEEDGLTFLESRNDDGLTLLDAREEDDDFDLFDERDDDVDFLSSFEELMAELEERSEDFDEDVEVEFAELESRSAGSILGSLKKIVKGIGAVNKALGKFGNSQQPSQPQALAVQKAAARLSRTVSGAIKTAKKSKKLNAKDSKKVFGYVKGKLAPAIIGSLKKIKAHKAGFKKGGYTGLVKRDLKKLSGEANKEGKALLSKAGSKSIKKKGAKILRKVKAAFKSALKAY